MTQEKNGFGNPLGNPDNSRGTAQFDQMQKTVGQGLCPLCGAGFDPKINVVIWTGKYWRAWFNPFPYAGTKTHLVFATIEHITDVSQLPAEAWTELGVQAQEFIKKYDLPGGGIVMRFGDNELNGGTISHLHAHIQVPNEEWFCVAVIYADRCMSAFLDDARKRWELFHRKPAKHPETK